MHQAQLSKFYPHFVQIKYLPTSQNFFYRVKTQVLNELRHIGQFRFNFFSLVLELDCCDDVTKDPKLQEVPKLYP